MQQPPAVLLVEAEPGRSGEVVRISDRDPVLLRHLDAKGIRVGTVLDVDGARRLLSAEALASIWIAA